MNNASKPARSEPPLPGRLVDGNDSANLQRSCGFLLGGTWRATVIGIIENFKLWLDELQLSPVLVFFYFPVEGDHLPGFESVTKISSVEPDTSQPGPALSGRHLEDGHSAGAK